MAPPADVGGGAPPRPLIVEGQLHLDGPLGRCEVEFESEGTRLFLPGLRAVGKLVAQAKWRRVARASGSLGRLVSPVVLVVYRRRVARVWWDDAGALHWRLTRWRREV